VIIALLVLQLLCGHHPHKKPKPKPDTQWLYTCRHIGWANEYPECRVREA